MVVDSVKVMSEKQLIVEHKTFYVCGLTPHMRQP
jgi:hypothetical protein